MKSFTQLPICGLQLTSENFSLIIEFYMIWIIINKRLVTFLSRIFHNLHSCSIYYVNPAVLTGNCNPFCLTQRVHLVFTTVAALFAYNGDCIRPNTTLCYFTVFIIFSYFFFFFFLRGWEVEVGRGVELMVYGFYVSL